jgi:hypothetical protein
MIFAIGFKDNRKPEGIRSLGTPRGCVDGIIIRWIIKTSK